MSSFDEFLRRGSNYDETRGVEYYEDAVEKGSPRARIKETSYQASQQRPPLTQASTIPGLAPSTGVGFQNFVMYSPRSPEDVESLIKYLRKREPAIINLDNLDDATAQRILDFLSGAIFALNGTISRVSGTNNIFLLSPEGVAVNSSIDTDRRF